MAEIGQAIFDLGRDDGMDGSHHQPVALHLAQGLRQHLLTDAGNAARQFCKAARSVILQLFQNE